MRNVTVISQDKVRAIATKLGLSIKEKKNELKVYGDAGISKSIAVPLTKGGATRIYLVGYAAEGIAGFIEHPKPPAKTVTVMVDHSMAEKLCLSAIYKAAKQLVGKPVAKPAPVTEEPAAPSAEPVVEASSSPEATAISA